MTIRKGQDYIVFSDDWGRHPFSCMHLVRRLLPASRVLWVNTIGMRYPRLTLYDLKRALGKLASWTGKSEAPPDLPRNLTVISPVMVPYNNIGCVRAFNRRSVLANTLEMSRRLGLVRPILLATVPNAADYVGHLGEALSVYYCVDEFSEWPGVARELVVSMERDLLGKVDMVVAVSDRLAASKTARRGPTHLLTHGVDADHFAAAQERAANPGAMENVSRPILGYYGLLDQRLDQELLEAVLRARPDWSVVAVGNAVTSLRRLERHANFHRLPAVPYQDLPAVARDFDVCIIPYVLNELSNNINPLKLKEYLAMGKPVVSTPLPEAEKLAPHVRLAGSAEAFVREVEAVLGGGFDPAPQLELVRSESWDGKADLLAAWISERLGGASADSAAGRAG